MTREEAIKQLGSLLAHCLSMKNDDEPIFGDDCEALKIAILSISPITREQVEKMCGKWIDERHSSKDVPKCQCSLCGKKYIGLESDFCQFCGAPMTDKAVDILWKRLEAMKDG